MSFGRQTGLADEYADRYAGAPSDHRIGETGVIPGRVAQLVILREKLKTVESATVVLILLVVALNFRAMGAPLVTLATAGIALAVITRTAGWIGERADVDIPSEIEPVIVALLLGIITDYSIFFLSGMRERLAAGDDRLEAARKSTTEFGPILFVAGLTVAAGCLAVLVAQVGAFRAFGPGMALTILISLLVLEPAGVESQPPPRGVLDLGPDQGVGVQLGVHAAAGVLAEQCRHQAPGVDLVDAVGAPPGHVAVAGHPVQGGDHGRVVSSEDLGPHPRIGREGPQDRDRLRGRECGIEAASGLVAEPPAEPSASVGVAGVEHVAQLIGLHLAGQVDGVAALSPPPSRRLVWVEVVVDRAAGATVPTLLVLGQPGVVSLRHARPGALQGRHPQHGGRPAGANALVRRFSASMRN